LEKKVEGRLRNPEAENVSVDGTSRGNVLWFKLLMFSKLELPVLDLLDRGQGLDAVAEMRF
jgi:hypothetical protein